jgi:hypothetical protein
METSETQIKKTEIEKPTYKQEDLKQVGNKDWLFELPNGDMLIRTKKDGEFFMTDREYDDIMRAKKLATRPTAQGETVDTDRFDLIAMSACLVYPKIPEMQLRKKRTSTIMRLRAGLYELIDINAFL